MTTSRVSEEELHAFIDGELEPSRAMQVAHLVHSDSLLARRVDAFQADKQRLLDIYGTVADQPLPDQWREMIERRSRAAHNPPAQRNIRPQLIAAIAAAILIVVALGIQRLQLQAGGDDAIISEALAARDNALRPQQSYLAADLAQPRQRNDVVAAALSMSVKTPDLARMGYRLERIRVFPAASGKAAELDYRDARENLFSLYLRRPTSPPRVDIVDREGVRICVWQDDVLAAVMVGKMSAGEMARLASLAYSGLNF